MLEVIAIFYALMAFCTGLFILGTRQSGDRMNIPRAVFFVAFWPALYFMLIYFLLEEVLRHVRR